MSGHTPGPWAWETTPSGEVRLQTPDRGKLCVMGFARKGMRGAQPRFSLWGEGARERRGGIMHDFAEAGGESHPDARLIAAAPLMVAELIRLKGVLNGAGYATEATDAVIAAATGDTK